MAQTTTSSTFNPDVLTDAVQGVMAQKNALRGSMFVASGAAVSEPGFTGGRDQLGTLVTIPYFGTLGDFQENLADGAAATPRELKMTSEQATVTRDSLAFEVTRWAQFAAAADPYREAARLLQLALVRQVDKRLLDASVAAGVREIDNSGSGITWDMVVDGKSRFGDEQDDIVAMLVHSQTKRDMLLLKDTQGRPLMVESQRQGDFDRFAGIPVGVSDRVSLAGSTMGAVTATGTTPPTVTLAGTPLGAWDLKIDVVVGGASDGTATFRFSTDDGATWSQTYAIPSGGGAFVLDESPGATNHQADSLVGFNGATGITATFANGTYNADNVYRAEANLSVRSMLLKRNSLAFWWNRAALTMQTDADILKDTDLAAMHLYAVAHRYRRRPGSHQTGIISLKHDVAAYDGTLDN